MRRGVAAGMAILVLCWAAPALAQRFTFFELDAGATVQAADAEFRELFGPSLVAGLKTGAFYRPPEGTRVGWVVEADFTLFDYQAEQDSDVYRLRLVGGARLERPLFLDWRLVVEAVGGLDFIVSSTPDTVLGTTVKEEDGNLGPVVEPSAGVLWQSGQLLLGAMAVVPLSYHYDGDRGDRTADFDYFGVELDLLFTIGASL